MTNKMLAALALAACVGVSACAMGRTDAPPAVEVMSAKPAEALRDCIVAAAGRSLPAGSAAPVVTPGSSPNAYLIAFPPLTHTGVVVERRGEGAMARWHTLDGDRFAGMPQVIRTCAAP